MSRVSQVKNKAPAPIQITAEQILRESMERVEAEPVRPRQMVKDVEELEEYRLEKRKHFEDLVRGDAHTVSKWLVYAAWEAKQNEFERARSVFERAIEFNYRSEKLWLKYAEMEMKNRFVNSARNVWDRAVTLMPRVDQFWYKYAYMEEMLGNVGAARQIFERWMEWQPDATVWNSYVRLEMRHSNVERARGIFERWLVCHPLVKTYLKYAQWEEREGNDVVRARVIYERALEELGEDAHEEELFVAFAKFEERHQEYERARTIYKYALDHLPRTRAQEVFERYAKFERQYGSMDEVEGVILAKRRFQYEEELRDAPHNYDVWFDYIRLEEVRGDVPRVREVYERAIANVPPVLTEKRLWRRYIYLWMKFAVFEELVAKDTDRTRQVYEQALKVIPHQHFTFAKIWLMYAKFELRQRNVDAFRRILGVAIGKCPKDRLFKGYIELELQLTNVDRCRQLYEQYLKWRPENCDAWTRYASLENALQERERARAIYEMAIQQPVLDTPEVLWKAYIDFETVNQEYASVRQLYVRLLERTKHVKVWISAALFEASVNEYDRARDLFTRAETYLKEENAKEERVMLLEAWVDFEQNFGTATQQETLRARMPKRLKKKRLLHTEDGQEAGWEEYYDYIFPDDQVAHPSLAILERARAWKLKQQQQKQEQKQQQQQEEEEEKSNHS